MKEQKMWVIKLNFKNKFKVIRENKRMKMQMRIRNNKMIQKCKEILREICIPKKNKKKIMNNKDKKNKQTKKWDLWTINNGNKI